jgi:acyl carrier protein
MASEQQPILDEVCGIVSDVMAVPTAQVNAQSSPKTIGTWDSTAHLNLILAIEEKYNLQLSPEEMDAMQSVGQIAAILEQKVSSSSR